MHIRLVLLAVLSGSVVTVSQAQFFLLPQGAAGVSVMIPRNQFSDHINGSVGYGTTLFFGAQIRDTPLLIGFEGGRYTYGLEVAHAPLDHNDPEIHRLIKTENGIYSGHFVLRFQHAFGPLTVYGEGLAGGKYLFTNSTPVWDSGDHGKYSEARTHFDDVTFSYGIGGGFSVPVFELFGLGVRLEAGVRYLLGGSAQYLTRGAITRTGRGDVAFTPVRSRTDALTPILGFSVDMW